MRTDPIVANQSGMALVLTLLIVSFLVAMTVQLMITVDRQLTASSSQREQVRLDAMVLGGLNLARAALLADQQDNTFDSPHDAWAAFDPDRLKSLTDDMQLVITVSDLSGRLQVNVLADTTNEAYRAVWLRFLLSGRFAVKERDEAEALLDAIGDWIDEDDDERPKGAESAYYQGLATPLACRNGPISTPEELLLVKGMTPVILYGDAEHEGLLPYVTVLGGDGKINLNAAPLPVLQALSSEMTRELAQELIDYRENRKNEETLATADWYRQVGGFPASIDLGGELLTVVGRYFSITVRASLHQYSRTGTGVLLRSDQGQRLLLWKVE
ncbi:type II secretory pathway component PulK-like protein [Desulfobulbus propionicus DSM 2032]|uniref:Type II secretory pathway component PulK-like protein n=1 Tax=Desulfobulbus propionicus (strain ATCC 33891 / DSM 2032 / VKM B-1956 / 1pr3) TaxID=577650 RepID=A0A7U3YK31_DESPD|nr:type II secretion system minor pseudopilin GspK [Desulfobulbus propionicus]ADW16836.1 type II secretory pathway component PulK-like protein [Desulfobulbus propionicus DSM 2032]